MDEMAEVAKKPEEMPSLDEVNNELASNKSVETQNLLNQQKEEASDDVLDEKTKTEEKIVSSNKTDDDKVSETMETENTPDDAKPEGEKKEESEGKKEGGSEEKKKGGNEGKKKGGNEEKKEGGSEGKKETEEEMEDEIDVFGDKQLVKKLLKPGKGRHTRPNFGEVCIFNVKTKLLDGTVLDEKSDHRCILGHLEVAQALDLTLMLMQIGETAEITSISKFTTPKLDFNPKNVPAGTERLVYEVELLDVDPIPNYSSMSSEELTQALLRKKQLGNFSMADDHTTALSTYNYAREIIDQATCEVDTSIKVAIWNNMAACYLKMGNNQSVVDYTNKVLNLQPNNVKALFRKGKALGLNGNYKEALEVLNKGIKIAEEKDLKLFHLAAADFKQKLTKSNEKEKAMYKAMFSPDPKAKTKKTKTTSGVSWWAIGACAAVVIAVGAALIKVNISNS